MKTCFKCGEEKESSEFYVHPRMTDGHLGKCKECAKKDANEHRAGNLDRIREYDRQRGKLPHRIRAAKLYAQTLQGKKSCAKSGKRYHNQYPIRRAAMTLLNNAVRDKRICKPKQCSKCGRKTRIMGHHQDYYKPLDVIWLCPMCHVAEHRGHFDTRPGPVTDCQDVTPGPDF